MGDWSWFASPPTMTMCSFSDIIYMNSGLQVIDIGVRGEYDTGIGASSLSVDVCILRIEVIQFDPHANIELMPVNIMLTMS
ncbi:unnamed protein product [Rotaria sp. Silwood1]|nr:unnamed protein product [Rotaria sp. Silwood1]CAF3686105.1 unnamed protein product [Rotaria sp. Silwood1]CAF4803408.1 unnamed protein product [Rotaria sp. Silwood1]